MKRGKYIPLGDYKKIKIGYGTVDFKNLKTIYLKLNSWVEPINESDDFDHIISLTRKNIKHLIGELRCKYFKQQCIVDLNIRTNGIKLMKKSFMNLEITLYVNEHFEIKNKETKLLITNIAQKVINNTLDNKTLYNFNKTKK